MGEKICFALVMFLVLVFSATVFGANCRDIVYAGVNGDLEETKMLVEEGCDVNSVRGVEESTALMLAAYGGHIEVVEFLINNGADVNIKNKDKTTALMNAAMNGHLDIVKLLIHKGADLSIKNRLHMTALMIAEHKGRGNVVIFLKKVASN